MKKTILWIISSILLLGAYSCENNSYAHKREQEKKDWETYRTSRNLDISTDSAYCFSQKLPWPENLYFQTERGVYLRMIVDDASKRKVQEGNTLIARYYIEDIYGNYISDNLSPDKDWKGYTYVYKKGSTVPSIAWIDIAPYVHNGSQFEMLIDSKVGTRDHMERVQTWRVFIREITVTN